MTDASELLKRYVSTGSDEAFAHVVKGHVHLVYSTALRITSDPSSAEDVTQQVFAELARCAPRVARHPTPTGWLYTTTRFMALRVIRAEQRRKSREAAAAIMQEISSASEAACDWDRLKFVLDQAMSELREVDRVAVLLRFFERKSLKEVADALDASENAARMRVERALVKLRISLETHGVKLTSAALAALISSRAVAAAPAHLLAAIAAPTISGAFTTGGFGFLKLATMANSKTMTVGILGLAVGALPVLWQFQTNRALRYKNTALLAQLNVQGGNDGLPSGVSQPTPPGATTHITLLKNAFETVRSSEAGQDHDMIAEMLAGADAPILTSAQLDPYLAKNNYSPSSLLAAFRASRDLSYLREAIEKYPNDPLVAYAAAARSDIPLDEQRRYLDILERSDPANALANYLSALNYFQSGQRDKAVEELVRAQSQSTFNDYVRNFMQNDEEAYRAAGYSEAEAKTIASYTLSLPQLPQLKRLTSELMQLASDYREAGDLESTSGVINIAAQLGERVASAPAAAMVTKLAGISIQNTAFGAMDAAGVDSTGVSVAERLQRLSDERDAIRRVARTMGAVQGEVSREDWINYKDRWRTFGEEQAVRWLTEKYKPAGIVQ